MFGSESFVNGMNEVQQPFFLESEALRETQAHIELWTAGNAAPQLPSPDQSPPREDPHICYGTVSHQFQIVPHETEIFRATT